MEGDYSFYLLLCSQKTENIPQLSAQGPRPLAQNHTVSMGVWGITHYWFCERQNNLPTQTMPGFYDVLD